jgi:hypothetical protein
VLRELSPLLHVLSIAILVGLWTGFRSRRAPCAVRVPRRAARVVSDSLWWHPDACVTFFVVATIAALVRDRRGSAVGSTPRRRVRARDGDQARRPVVLRRGGDPSRARAAGRRCARSRCTARGSPRDGARDARGEPDAVRARGVGEGVGVQATVPSIIAFGWGERSSTGLAAWLRRCAAATAASSRCPCAGSRSPPLARDRARRDLARRSSRSRSRSRYLIFGVAYQSERYLLPALLPLASCAGSDVWLRALRDASAPRARASRRRGGASRSRGVRELRAERSARYRDVLERERASASLAFYRELDAKVISALPATARLRILRTPTVYVPPDPRFDVHLRWAASSPTTCPRRTRI